jgi:hypothetical protein
MYYYYTNNYNYCHYLALLRFYNILSSSHVYMIHTEYKFVINF